MELLDRGLTMEEVSHRVGTSIASVSRWRKALAEGGPEALAAKPVPGRPRKLSKAECSRLLELLLEGAMAYGYANELWTLKRIAEVIEKQFGVRYAPPRFGTCYEASVGAVRNPKDGPANGTKKPSPGGVNRTGRV